MRYPESMSTIMHVWRRFGYRTEVAATHIDNRELTRISLKHESLGGGILTERVEDDLLDLNPNAICRSWEIGSGGYQGSVGAQVWDRAAHDQATLAVVSASVEPCESCWYQKYPRVFMVWDVLRCPKKWKILWSTIYNIINYMRNNRYITLLISESLSQRPKLPQLNQKLRFVPCWRSRLEHVLMFRSDHDTLDIWNSCFCCGFLVNSPHETF